MVTDPSFAGVMSRLRAGDAEAARQIFDRFAQRLIGLARCHLDSKIRQKVDPEDVLQSAYKSFFIRFAQGQFDLASWDNLWSLLTVLTVRKCRRWTAHFRTHKRNVDAEMAPVAAGEPGPDWQALATDPTPPEVAMLADLVEGLLQQLPLENQPILSLALQNYSAAEIGQQLNRPERTVARVLKRIRDQLEQVLAQDISPE